MTKYPLKLKDGFVLRCAASDGDVERLAAFNERVHRGEDLAVLVRALADEPPPAALRRGPAFFRAPEPARAGLPLPRRPTGLA
jgi:hypothetical protein